MPSYRPIPAGKLHTWFGLQAQVLAGGYFKFYDAGTTTPQNVYGDPELTVNNGSQIDLDSSGRLSVDVWASTDDRFFIELYDANDVKQGELDDVEVPGGAAQVVPVPGENEVLGGDGDNYVLLDITGKWLPDMTGNANKILGTDGSTASWTAKPADGAAGVSDIVIGSGSLKLSNGSNHVLQQWATDSVAGGGGLSVSDSVTFGTAYSATPVVDIIVTGSNASSAGNVEVDWRVSAVSTTGFTVVFSSRTGGSSADLSGNSNLTGTINYAWRAIGTTAS
jgi:hypothetical protein